MAMTVGEHDSLWKAGAKSLQHIPEIAQSLRRQNAIKILEDLYAINKISEEDYSDDLLQILINEGYKL